MNRLDRLFEIKSGDILNVYFTAGFPRLDSTVEIIKTLEDSGVDLVELGMPYSDPMADGPTIQQSSDVALKNGMSLELIFSQVTEARKSCSIPIILMGYYNQLLQFGMEKFLTAAHDAGVDGLIIPDLPMFLFKKKYQAQFDAHNIRMTFLITPETSDERILEAASLSKGFIYVVSKSSITGGSKHISEEQVQYFERVKNLGINNPLLIGFGIHDRSTYETACKYSNGAIIGSAFIRHLEKSKDDLQNGITSFIQKIRF